MGEHVPQSFASREDEARFWESVDLTNLAPDQLEEVKIETPDRPRTTTFAVRLDQRTVQLLRQIARSMGLGPTQLVRSWILERLKLELEAGQFAEDQVTTYPLEFEQSLRKSIVHSLIEQIPALTESVLNDVLERADFEASYFEAETRRED